MVGGVLVATALVATFWFAQLRTERVLAEQSLARARAFAQEVVAIRQFVNEHGGVYVESRPGVEENPYLIGIPGVKARIVSDDGTEYVLRNPALVVREMNAELSRLSGEAGASFHLASDAPMNPENTADRFETAALEAFASGATEHEGFERREDGSVYRYAYPLQVDDKCVACHFREGWQSGQIRGTISLELDAGAVDRAIAEGRGFTVVAIVGSISTLLLALYLITTRLLRSLLKAESDLRELATRDSLTGLLNRRAALSRLADEIARADREGHSMAALMADIDRFKDVNDAAGHAVGDAVLLAVAEALRTTARTYDVVARLGGEEFLVVMPTVGSDEAVAAAERMRHAVSEATTLVEGWGRPVTVSIGVATRMQEGASLSDTLRQADRALYAAKEAGRDRVMSL